MSKFLKTGVSLCLSGVFFGTITTNAFANEPGAEIASETLASLAIDDSIFQSVNTADNLFGAGAIDDKMLSAIAGREDVNQTSTATQTAGVSRNSVGSNSVTGNATVSDNAFQNLSGLSILNVNTGNNVAINASMNVNISISPGQ